MSDLSEDGFCNSLYGEIQEAGTCGWYVRQSHVSLEKGLPTFGEDARVLEVGCNLGEHIPYVRHPYSEYVATDYRQVAFEPLNSRTRFEVADVQDLHFDDNSFDRIIMTCVLHHLDDPSAALEEIRRVARNGAVISILLPNDPGMVYRLGKWVGPYRRLRKELASIDPECFHYLQHRNHFPGLAALMRNKFKPDSMSRRNWPFPWKSWNFNLYSVYQIVVRKTSET